MKLKPAPIDKLLNPLRQFMHFEPAAGLLLLVVTAIALAWANSPWVDLYNEILHTSLTVGIGPFVLQKTFQHFVNDALMVVFFFVVGAEIKRELISGELSSRSKAALPIIAAIGGMIVPATIYAFFNHDGEGAGGWGIPMATDIAFAVGILSLMSRKVPYSLKVFLLALAIVDDLGAVLVIALFYTAELSLSALSVAAISLLAIWVMQLLGVRNILCYCIMALITWLAVFQSGVHATVAGVLLGFLTPSKPWLEMADVGRHIKESLEEAFGGKEVNSHLKKISKLSNEAQSPLDRLIKTLHPWVTFAIMPLFAFANAGVTIGNFGISELVAEPVSTGIILGLLLGKPIGILGASFLAVKLKLTQLPRGSDWLQIGAISCLAGIGFTMALFISNLALAGHSQEALAKISILLASFTASILGLVWLKLLRDV